MPKGTSTASLFESSVKKTAGLRLLKLRLKNFKGIADLSIEADAQNISIYGDNATGKTTIFDAFTWLLFGKDSTGMADFAIKPLDTAGQPVHNLETEVEGIFQIGGTTPAFRRSFRKVFSEKWTKKRGSASAEFTGHTVDHFVDGIPVQKKDFDATVAEIAREDIFKLLTNPVYFNENLHWQERRKILLEICGDISDEHVISANPELANLPGILQGRKLEDHRKVIVAQRTEINKQLEKIPVRIDEVRRGLPEIGSILPAKLTEDLAKLRTELASKQAEFARIENGGEIAEKTKQLRMAEAALYVLIDEARRDNENKINNWQKSIDALYVQMRELDIAAHPILNNYSNLEAQANDLRTRWYEINALGFLASEVCPTCGQSLPAEQIEAARANFNRQKSEQLEQISELGKTLTVQIEQMRKENDEKIRCAEVAEASIKEKRVLIGELQGEIELLRTAPPSSPAITAKQAEIDALQKEINNLQINVGAKTSAIRSDINHLNNSIAELEKANAVFEQRKRDEARIDELATEEKRLATEYERLERELYLTDEFIRTKVRLLEDRINSHFKLARFKLFNMLINGGVEECCETLFDGVPYSGGLNNGARINVGLDIINALSEHYEFSAPIFIDNREAVTKLIPVNAQLISLIVSEPDKKLRIEKEAI